MRSVAIIPARGGSKRIPRKNIADINGQPMISYPIRTALESGIFDRVIVSTDDPEIKQISLSCGAEVSDRPVELATDEAFEIDVYGQVLDTLPTRPQNFCAIYPTAIFINEDDIKGAFDQLSGADVVMGASRYPIHPFKALRTNAEGYAEMVHPKECLQRSQTYPEYVASNGTFYWFDTESYFKYKSYYAPKLKTFAVPTLRAVDIDEPEDLHFARALMGLQNNG